MQRFMAGPAGRQGSLQDQQQGGKKEQMTPSHSALLLLGGPLCLLGGISSAFIVRPSADKVWRQSSSRLPARLTGGSDPPFKWGQEGGPQSGALLNNLLKLNSTEQSDLPPKLETFMGGRQLTQEGGGLVLMTGNQYLDLLVTMSPNELISRFKATAPPRVQEAVKKTALRCIGSIREYVVEDMHKTTGVLFANLLYKAEITGYMLYNCEEMVTAAEQVQAKALAPPPPKATGLLLSSGASEPESIPPLTGTIKVVSKDGVEVEVDAQQYIEALKTEASSIKAELARLEQERKEIVSRDLLAIIQEMSTRQSAALTSGMTEEVVQAMKMLVSRVLVSIQDKPIGGTDTVELPSSALGQLIMWGLVTGFQLRELEKAWGNFGKPASTAMLTQPLQQQQPPPPRKKRSRGRRPGPPEGGPGGMGGPGGPGGMGGGGRGGHGGRGPFGR